jgi:hypothetical protein
MSTTWKKVPGWPGLEASDDGRVRSTRRKNVRILKPHFDRGYWRLSVWLNGKAHHKGVHQLVALAFIGPRPDGHEVRHLDGNGTNTVPTNLEYATPSVNQADKVRHGTHNMARKTHCLRGHELNENNVSLIRLATGSVARRCKSCQREKAAARKREVLA